MPSRPEAYRLSGPLEPVVCGAHLKRGYRLAFTTQPPAAAEADDRIVVVVLYVVHDLFDVRNPPAAHDKPPCCEHGPPRIADTDLDDFVRALRRLQRGR